MSIEKAKYVVYPYQQDCILFVSLRTKLNVGYVLFYDEYVQGGHGMPFLSRVSFKPWGVFPFGSSLPCTKKKDLTS